MAGYVLIVESDADLQRQIGSALREAGFELHAEAEAAWAKRTVVSRVPDVVVIDTRLVDGDGFTFADELRQSPETRATPIVFVASTHRGVSHRAEARRRFAPADYLPTPLDLARLAPRVAELAARGAAARAPEAVDVADQITPPPVPKDSLRDPAQQRERRDVERSAKSLAADADDAELQGTLEAHAVRALAAAPLREAGDGIAAAAARGHEEDRHLRRRAIRCRCDRTSSARRWGASCWRSASSPARSSPNRSGACRRKSAIRARSSSRWARCRRSTSTARWSNRSRRSCSRCSRGWTASSCSRRARRGRRRTACSSARPPRRSSRASAATTTRRARQAALEKYAQQYVGLASDPQLRLQDMTSDPVELAFIQSIDGSKQLECDPRARRDPARQGAPAAGGAVGGGHAPAPRGHHQEEGRAAAVPIVPPVSSVPVLGAPAAPPPTTAPLASGQLSMMLQTVRTQDYFWALDVGRDAPVADIDRAYEALARSFHTDRYRLSSEEDRKAAQEIFDKLGEAHRTLRDPAKRKAYLARLERDEEEEKEKEEAYVAAPAPDDAAAPDQRGRRHVTVQRRGPRPLRRRPRAPEGAPAPRGGRSAAPGRRDSSRTRPTSARRSGGRCSGRPPPTPAQAGRPSPSCGARCSSMNGTGRPRSTWPRSTRRRASPTWPSRNWNACWPSTRPPPKLPKSCTGCERSSAARNAVAPPCATDRNGPATSVSWCPRAYHENPPGFRGSGGPSPAAAVSRHAVCSIARA